MQHSYERHLPHQVPQGFPLFLTWNLKGALPREALDRLAQKHQELEWEPARAGEKAQARKLRHGKVLFALEDDYLDRTAQGPRDLANPAAAAVVEDSLLFGVPERYELFAWCVMANHVHVLLKPYWELKKITQGIKGYTAHAINALQQQRGRVFWQDESYDHWARDEDEMLRIIDYIENNPVAAHLCVSPEDWRWSSARQRSDWPRGQPWRRPT
jgi:REP element-mobilizing transposase RayT